MAIAGRGVAHIQVMRGEDGACCVEISAPTGIARVRLDLVELCVSKDETKFVLRFPKQQYCEGLVYYTPDGAHLELSHSQDALVCVSEGALDVVITGAALAQMKHARGELFYVNQYR